MKETNSKYQFTFSILLESEMGNCSDRGVWCGKRGGVGELAVGRKVGICGSVVGKGGGTLFGGLGEG